VLPCSPFFLLTEMPRWVSLAIAAFRFGAGGVVSSLSRSTTSAASFLGLAGVVSFVISMSVGPFSDSVETSGAACMDPEVVDAGGLGLTRTGLGADGLIIIALGVPGLEFEGLSNAGLPVTGPELLILPATSPLGLATKEATPPLMGTLKGMRSLSADPPLMANTCPPLGLIPLSLTPPL